MDDAQQLKELAELIREADRYMIGEENFADWIEVVGESVLAARRLAPSLGDYARWCRSVGKARTYFDQTAKAWLAYKTLCSQNPRPVYVAQCISLLGVDRSRLACLWGRFIGSHPQPITVPDIKRYFQPFKDKRHYHRLPPLGSIKKGRSDRYDHDFLECSCLPLSHLTESEIAELDAYIAAESKKIRDGWTIEEEAARRGVPMGWQDVDSLIESAGAIHSPLEMACVKCADISDYLLDDVY